MTAMTVLVWVVEGTWEGCVDAARSVLPADAEVTLLHVTPGEVAEVAGGAAAGLLGRDRRPGRDPARRIQAAGELAAAELLDAAQGRLGRPAAKLLRQGRVERLVVEAADGVDLLVCARDGDRARLGPHSLGPATRFVVDHAPCTVLLAWPAEAPGLGSIPSAPSAPPPPPGRLPGPPGPGPAPLGGSGKPAGGG
jgi:nucleotide-binding universal stress UspA family protein